MNSIKQSLQQDCNDTISMNQYMQYKLVVPVDKNVAGSIRQERLLFANHYHHPVLQEEPAIHLAFFEAKEVMEDTIFRWIQKICSLQQSFFLTLNNYGSISSHTIYLQVQDALPLVQLIGHIKTINGFLQSAGFAPVQASSLPRVEIANGLTQPYSQKAIAAYLAKSFNACFPVTTLSLFKRPNNQEAYRLITKFSLPIQHYSRVS